MRGVARVRAAAALALCVPCVRAQGETGLARVSSVPLPEGFAVVEAISCDVDGDGMADLVIAVAGVSRRLQVHLRRADGPAFVPAPDAALDLTPDTVAFAAADVHADPGREILLFGASVVVAWRWRATEEADSYERLLAADFLWQWPDRHDVLGWQAGVKDLDGDGREDLVIPGPGKYTVAFQRDGPDGARAFAPPVELAPGAGGAGEADRTLEVRQPGGRRRASVSFSGGGIGFSSHVGPEPWITVAESVPAPQLVDWDGDGDLDLACVAGSGVTVFVQEPRGSFGGNPLRLQNPVVADRRRRLDVSYSMRAIDLDRDGRFDCVISAGDQRSEDARTQVLVFLQKAVAAGEEPLFGNAGMPAQVLVLDGLAAPIAIEDVDGDGLPDLVAGSVRPDLIDGLRTAASEHLDAELYVFRNTGSGFAQRPALTHRLAVEAPGREFTARFLGDVTGDGVAELIERADQDRLRVHLVRRTRDGLAVAGKPLFELAVDARARVLLPGRLGRETPDIFVLEKGAVRCVTLR